MVKWSAPEKRTLRVYLPKHGHVWYLFYRNRRDKSFSELCTNLQPKLQSVVCQCKALPTDLLCVACDYIVEKKMEQLMRIKFCAKFSE